MNDVWRSGDGSSSARKCPSDETLMMREVVRDSSGRSDVVR